MWYESNGVRYDVLPLSPSDLGAEAKVVYYNIEDLNMAKLAKSKAIDLGQLQDTYTLAKKTLASDAKALAKAQDVFERSKKQYQDSFEALKSAARTVLD